MEVGREIGAFRSLQLAVRDNPLFLRRVRVVYGNGRYDDFRFNKEIEQDTASPVMDLSGDARFIKEIRMRYSSVGPLSDPAKVIVYGLRN